MFRFEIKILTSGKRCRFSFGNKRNWYSFVFQEWDRIIGRLDLPDDDIFIRCLKRGVAYHHRGLSNKKRVAVEILFRKKFLKVCVNSGTYVMGEVLNNTEYLYTFFTFWSTYGDIWFQSQSGQPYSHLVTHSLRFTSGVTPANLLVASMTAKPSSSTYLWAGIGGVQNQDLLCCHSQCKTRQMPYWLSYASSAWVFVTLYWTVEKKVQKYYLNISSWTFGDMNLHTHSGLLPTREIFPLGQGFFVMELYHYSLIWIFCVPFLNYMLDKFPLFLWSNFHILKVLMNIGLPSVIIKTPFYSK